MARTADRRIDEAQERVDRLRAKLEAGRMSSITGMPRGGDADWTKTADRLILLEQRVNARVREMCALQHAAMDVINRVEEARLREVLELYYLDGFTWDQVAERMGFKDVRWFYELHGRALRLVKVPEEVEKHDE